MALCLRRRSYGEGRNIHASQNSTNCFYMYPEEALGPCVQSATIMWEHIERLFCNVRQLMQKSGGARSGSFSIPWTAACMSFFQVKWNRYFVVVACCKLILLFSAMKIGHDET